jgi:hypothetical protein
MLKVCEASREILGYSNFRVVRKVEAGAEDSLQFEALFIARGFDIDEEQIVELQQNVRIAAYLRSENGLGIEQAKKYEAYSEPFKNMHAQLRDDFLKKKANGKIATPIRIELCGSSIELKGKFANLEACDITKIEKEVHGVIEMLDKNEMLCGLRFQEIGDQTGDQSPAIKTLKVSFNISKYWSCLYEALGTDLPLKLVLQQQIESTKDGNKTKLGKWTIHSVSDPLEDFKLG